MKRPFLAAVFLFAALPLGAQVPDARLLPPGTFRWAFTPSWNSWDRVLDSLGNERLLRSFVSSDSAGADLFPTLTLADAALRGLTGNPTLRLSLGAMNTTLDADVRRFPLEFAVGAGRRLTITGTLPMVVTRMNSSLALDSTKGNVGWNQLVPQAGNTTAPAAITNLLSQFNSSATQLSQRITAGNYGCPGGATQAQALLARLQNHRLALTSITGSGGSAAIPAVAPTEGSIAGQAMAAAIRGDSLELAQCGLPNVLLATLPLPSRRLSATDVQSIFTSGGLGYESSGGFQYTKRTALGDVELGLRFGAVDAPHARLVLFGGARLPTGRRELPDNLIDIGPADRQLDVIAGFEAALEPGAVISLALSGSYNRQFADELDLRDAAPGQFINTGPIVRVSRNLGDEIRLSAYPGLRLNDAFRVYGGGSYYRKGADSYTTTGGPTSLATSVQEALAFGGGIQYRSVGGRRNVPTEAGLLYSAVYTGSGVMVPKSTTLTMYLRFFYRLWGAGSGEQGAGSETP